jgi:hypothetical protein
MAGSQLISRRISPLFGSLSLPGLAVAGVGVVTWQRLVARRHPQGSWLNRARELVSIARH